MERLRFHGTLVSMLCRGGLKWPKTKITMMN